MEHIQTYNTKAVQLFTEAITIMDTSSMLGASLFDLAFKYKDWKGSYYAIKIVGAQYPVVPLLYNRTFDRIVSKLN